MADGLGCLLVGLADVDEPPRSDAGQDVVIQLPTDWAVLDGRDSVDDHGISHYEWTLIKGDTAIGMKVSVGPQSSQGRERERALTGRDEIEASTRSRSVSCLLQSHDFNAGICSNFLVFVKSTEPGKLSLCWQMFKMLHETVEQTAQIGAFWYL